MEVTVNDWMSALCKALHKADQRTFMTTTLII
jgi:hypothetical protein